MNGNLARDFARGLRVTSEKRETPLPNHMRASSRKGLWYRLSALVVLMSVGDRVSRHEDERPKGPGCVSPPNGRIHSDVLVVRVRAAASATFCRPSVPGVTVRMVIGLHLRVQQGGALYTNGRVTVSKVPGSLTAISLFLVWGRDV